ncbi:MAG: UDP-N-acetylmuramoyl-tripeptide--D-alanyl-D-alanine ligase [Patescibacteria group bacterium]|nr:UDP-N-acetylmuramoyl-tripeptide--D-alanyl-D-alanine ligase [Patescibacteria group bacterium]
MQKTLEKILAMCVKRAVRREKPLIVGIAGSVGKTSTKDAVGIALGAKEKHSGTVMSEKNFNNDLGVPLTIYGQEMPKRSVVRWLKLLLKAKLSYIGLSKLRARTFVLELGTDRPGDLARLMSLVTPKIGVFTAVGAEHTEFFGSVDAVAEEEAAIVRLLPSDGTIIFNQDDLRVIAICRDLPQKKISFGTDPLADVRLVSKDVVLDEQNPDNSGMRLKISSDGRINELMIRGTVGKPQALSVCAAIAAAKAVGEDMATAIKRLQHDFNGVPGRMRILRGIKRTWLLDDTYNSSPLAAFSALQDLASFPIEQGGRRIAALGDMLELGPLADEAHLMQGKAAAESGIDLLVACGTLAHVTARGAVEAGMPEDKVFTFPKSPEAGLFIQERLGQNDVVLVKGSQSIRMEKVTKELMARPDRAEELLVRHDPDWLAR